VNLATSSPGPLLNRPLRDTGDVFFIRGKVLRQGAGVSNKNPGRLAKRLALYKFRVPEELYDVAADPDCLSNLIDSPEHRAALGRLRKQLERWMVKTDDPLLETFRRRDDAEFRESVVQAQEREAMARKAKRRKNK